METEEQFYLLDLERTISNNVPYFWNGNRHGYTNNLRFAGLFSEWTAQQIVKGDYDNRTIMISQRVVSDILGKDMKQHEGSTITSTS
jgi:hypothetical protein